MGKTPKKAAPGGDERNLYVRRLKATSTLSSESCDSNLTMRQRESDNSNRIKPSGVQKRIPVPVTNVFKSKLRSPAKTRCHQALKSSTRFQPATSKDEKKLVATTTAKPEDNETTTMHTEKEEPPVELKVSIPNKEVKEAKEACEKTSIANEGTKNEGEICTSDATSNGKDASGTKTETEEKTLPDERANEGNTNLNVETSTTFESSMEKCSSNGDESSGTITNENNKEETELGNAESDESSLKLIDEPEESKSIEENSENPECTTNGPSVEGNSHVTEEKTPENEVEKATVDFSDDVVESTTSETSDSGNVTQSDKEGETTERSKQTVNESSFVTYDSPIMLKNVQIKLNDCLKDNSKLFDVSNAEESNAAEQEKRMDMSFGKTLRNISGRSTINRLKYVTVREHRFSPNSSLFVNTSSASLDPDDSTSCKLVRYPTDISDSIICNGSPAERKRKIAESASASAKKLKTDSNSLLNTSLGMLKAIRSPVKVSTPNTKGYNFQTDKFSPKSFGDEKLTIDGEVEPKKWCVVM